MEESYSDENSSIKSSCHKTFSSEEIPSPKADLMPTNHAISVLETVEAVKLIEAIQKCNLEKVGEITKGDISGYRSQFGTLLHLAASFGGAETIEKLIELNVPVNFQTSDGNTALHVAAKEGRLAAVEALLRSDLVDDTITNKDGKTPFDLAKNRTISFSIEYSRSLYINRMTNKMHQLASKEDEAGLRELFGTNRNRLILNINAPDNNGETILHRAARQDNLSLVQTLLELGADPFVENRKSKIPIELARDENVKNALKEAPMIQSTAIPVGKSLRVEGYLHKWTNYAEGYKRRWFVLEDGVFSYFKTQADYPVSCRGSIRLQWAKVCPHSSDRLRFEVTTINDPSMHFHLRADTPADAKRWLISLNQAQAVMSNDLSEGNDTNQELDDEAFSDQKVSFADRRDSAGLVANTYNSYMNMLSNTLNKLSELEIMIRSSIESETILTIESTGILIHNIREGLLACEEREKQWQEKYEQDLGQRNLLEDALKVIALENSRMGTLAKIHAIGGEIPLAEAEKLSATEAEQFYDALEAELGEIPTQIEKFLSVVEPEYAISRIPTPEFSFIETAIIGYPERCRKTIPSDSTNMPPVSLWSILKSAIGKDLTKIPVPVNYSEPLSMLQRLCEEMDYSELIDRAYKCNDPVGRLQLIAAFAISSYASSDGRISKPFNPLLGETFEYVNREKGYRYIAEQVSHHPPISACYCESARYELWAEVKVKSKFWGKSMELVPEGTTHLMLKAPWNEHYSWRKVTTTVNNIIVGKLWIDHYGLMRVINHKTGHVCEIEFSSAGWRTSECKRITGQVLDADGEVRGKLAGYWHKYMAANKIEEGLEEEMTEIWHKRPNPANCEKFYNFTEFAMSLNELTPELSKAICPTDSRLRPDQRAMEEGDFDGANKNKSMLEQKQRDARKLLEMQPNFVYKPRWFQSAVDKDTGAPHWEFTGEYWEARAQKEWNKVPEIFL